MWNVHDESPLARSAETVSFDLHLLIVHTLCPVGVNHEVLNQWLHNVMW